MFSGIVKSLGRIISIDSSSKDWIMQIQYDKNLKTFCLGDSIACDGICLTIIKQLNDTFTVEISEATRSCTNIERWHKDYILNLEQSLSFSDRLHGHFVLGHIDNIATIVSIKDLQQSHEIKLSLPRLLQKYLINKGSIALNGVSLTINHVDGNQIHINVISHTWKHTNFSHLKLLDIVNVEIDYLAKILIQHASI